jgi:hypothetical protein
MVITDDEYVRIWKGTVVAYLEILLWHLLERLRKSQKASLMIA